MIGVPEFYAGRLGAGFVSHDELLRARLRSPLAALACRSSLVRGLALGWIARRGGGIAVIRRERGSLPALLVCGLPPARRRVFVLELIRRPLPGTGWRRMLYHLWWRAVEVPALRRGMSAAQVMSAWEGDEYAAHYGLDRSRLVHVPWAFREGGHGEPAAIEEGSRAVFCSGRTACDWETVFAAASPDWELVVACSPSDAARVRELAAPVGAEVAVELPWDEHDRRLRAAAVYVIAILEREMSAGQVRLMAAVEAGVPVVASRVPALDGYVVEGETAELVAPADPDALRRAVGALLGDPGRRRRLRDAARERADAWTYSDYFERLSTAIKRVVSD